MPKLRTYDHAWPLTPETCPPDLDFAAYLEERQITGASIFHFGTGAHHELGKRAARLGNVVLGITASIEEHAAYVQLAIEEPELASKYRVLFGDIYSLDRRHLPPLDYACLFHLCEFPDPLRAEYGATDDYGLAREVLEVLRPGREIVFYVGSMAFEEARVEVIWRLWNEKRITLNPPYWRSLLFASKAV